MTKQDLDIFASEYALGILDAGKCAEAERLCAKDAAFAQMVREWEQRLAPLSEAIPPLDPPASAWRKIAIALALVWMGGLDSPFRQVAPEERYVALLQSNAGETGFVITMNMKSRQFAIRPAAAKTPPAKSYELWAMMKDDKPPMTLGLVGTGAYAMRDAPVEIDHEMLEKGVKLAISLEPEGGASAGKSMGPVMFAGLLVKQSR